MRFKFEFYFVAVAFIVVMWIATYGSTHYGYIDTYGNRSSLHLYPFQDGFEGGATGVLPVSDQIVADITPQEINKVKEQNPDPIQNAFDNNKLKGADYSSIDPVDPMSKLDSSMTCEPSGLTKGGGNLCLTEDIKSQLSTRGSNNM